MILADFEIVFANNFEAVFLVKFISPYSFQSRQTAISLSGYVLWRF